MPRKADIAVTADDVQVIPEDAERLPPHVVGVIQGEPEYVGAADLKLEFAPAIWYELVLYVGLRSNIRETPVHVSRSVDKLKDAALKRAGHTLDWQAAGDTHDAPVAVGRGYRIRPLVAGYVVE